MLLVTAACSGDNDGATVTAGSAPECTPAEIAAPAEGGTYVVNVKAESEWTAYASDDARTWIAVKVSGSTAKEGAVTLTVSANSGTAERAGMVIVSGGKDMIIPVSQAAPMQVSMSKVSSASTGETFTLSVTAANDWEVVSNDSWIKAEKTGDKTFALTTEPNEEKTTRRGTVDVISGSRKLTVEVEQNSAEDRDIVTPEGYRLVWNDEFNEGTTLNSSSWTHEVKPAGWVNNELQTYVNGQAGGQRVSELADGRLRINCFKASDGKIYSGRVYANVRTGWQYGYFEARIKLPQGKGTWPAFWMMPVNFSSWPDDGEIDIMEEVGADANIVSSTIHCNKYNNSGTSVEHGDKYVATAESDFHVYACEWTPDFLKFFVDGDLILNYRNDGTGYDAWPFDQPYYVILNLAWGGAWGGYKGVDENALPITMEVDYVRVFQKK